MAPLERHEQEPKLHPTSMSYIYKVFEHLKQLRMGIWQHTHTVTEIELLAIVETLKEFKGMLWGQIIKVYTDHKNLTRDALGLTLDRVHRWRLLLDEYGLGLQHQSPHFTMTYQLRLAQICGKIPKAWST